MFTSNTIRSACCALAVALGVVSCDSAGVTPVAPIADDGADLSRAEAHAYGAWTLAVSIEATPGTDPGFNTSSVDGCPNISRDGKTFYLASNRPGSLGLDIWVSTRDNERDGWSNPIRLGTPVNAPPSPHPAHRSTTSARRSPATATSSSSPAIGHMRTPTATHRAEGTTSTSPAGATTARSTSHATSAAR